MSSISVVTFCRLARRTKLNPVVGSPTRALSDRGNKNRCIFHPRKSAVVKLWDACWKKTEFSEILVHNIYTVTQSVHHHHHHHHISVMQLGHLLTRSGLTYPEVSSKAYHDSFCQLDSSVSLPWVICFEVFYLHIVSSFSCIPVICPILVLFLTPLQFVHLFCNLSKCILLFF